MTAFTWMNEYQYVIVWKLQQAHHIVTTISATCSCVSVNIYFAVANNFSRVSRWFATKVSPWNDARESCCERWTRCSRDERGIRRVLVCHASGDYCTTTQCGSVWHRGPTGTYNASCAVYNASWLWDSWAIAGPRGTTERRGCAAPGSRQQGACCASPHPGYTLNGCGIIDIVLADWANAHSHGEHPLSCWPPSRRASWAGRRSLAWMFVLYGHCLGCHYIHYSAALLISPPLRLMRRRYSSSYSTSHCIISGAGTSAPLLQGARNTHDVENVYRLLSVPRPQVSYNDRINFLDISSCYSVTFPVARLPPTLVILSVCMRGLISWSLEVLVHQNVEFQLLEICIVHLEI